MTRMAKVEVGSKEASWSLAAGRSQKKMGFED